VRSDTEDEAEDFLVIESTKIEPSCPYHYLPFSQTPEMCTRKVQNWLQQIWFLPSDWRVSLRTSPPKPCYVPFFVFDVITSTNYEASVSTIDSRDAGSVGNKWEFVQGNFSNSYNEIIVCGSCSVNQKLVQKLLKQSGFSYQTQRILPSDPPVYKQSIHFNEEILPLEITREEAWELSGHLCVQEWEEQRARKDIKMKYLLGNMSDQIRNFRIDLRFSNKRHYIVLLPIYFVGFEYGSQVYEVLVSGNLGVVVGNRPIGTGSGGKYLIDKIKSVGNLVSETVSL